MNVDEAILKRRSVRSYSDKPLSKEKIEEIMESTKMAPSAANKQDWKFVIVTDDEVKEEIYQAARRQNQVKEAPAVIAGITTDPEGIMECDIPTGVVDLTIALDHLTLKAAEEGLGTCWIGAFNQKKAKKALNVPSQYKIVSLMTIGYPDNLLEKVSKNRKDLKDIVVYDKF